MQTVETVRFAPREYPSAIAEGQNALDRPSASVTRC